MFLRRNQREKDGKRHTYWSLVETVCTADGSLAAHFEHTVAVTESGAEVLTAR